MKHLLALLLICLATPVLAANPVKMSADEFVINEDKSEATFTGNVVMAREDITMWASKVVVEFEEGGLQNMKLLTATGKVRIKTEDQDATGEQAVFDPDSQILRLTGNVRVVNSAGTLNGPELVVNLAEKTSVFSSNQGGRVTGVFNTE
jgi:lipopolysaccharide export system protein LptA